MVRYFVSLMITVLMVTIVLISWTPTAKAQDGCSSYCESAFICACAAKFGGNLRETRCEFNAEPTCEWGVAYGYEGYYCNCDPDPRCFNWKEHDRVWLAFPQPYSPCDAM
jgi:hypothetical protein